jgi:hypothetical protein
MWLLFQLDGILFLHLRQALPVGGHCNPTEVPITAAKDNSTLWTTLLQTENLQTY